MPGLPFYYWATPRNTANMKNKRFVQAPPQEVMDRLAAETQAQAKEKENLDKKMHYLETTYKNSRDNFEQILKNAGMSSGGS